LDIASHYIDAKVKKALEDAESLRRKLLINESSAVSVERRFSLRVVVPPGAMDVHWIAQSGQPAQSPAIDISMQSVKFAAGEAEVKAVTRIICPKMGVELGVVQSKINRQEAQHAVATLVEFDNNLDDWMCWVEIITRIDQKSAEA
jgi:hypothetical protein